MLAFERFELSVSPDDLNYAAPQNQLCIHLDCALQGGALFSVVKDNQVFQQHAGSARQLLLKRGDRFPRRLHNPAERRQRENEGRTNEQTGSQRAEQRLFRDSLGAIQ